MSKPFVLRSLHGPNARKYFVCGDYQGIKWTDDVSQAMRVSAEDAYGHIAAAIDMLCQAMAPECVDATSEDCKRFSLVAAKDMFQVGGQEIQDLICKSIRRSADDPFYEIPADLPAKKSGYMSVWEWIRRISFRGEPTP